ncbi:MAG: YceI family protein [Nitrospirota bacterium]
MSKWSIDPDHSTAAFAIRHMMIANVRGQFNKITGAIDFAPEDIEKSTVEVAIDVASLVSGVSKRDDHLRSPDFFDASGYPDIKFRSTKIEKTGDSRCRVSGDLTIHGVTHPVSMEVEFTGPVKSPFGETSMGFSAALTINREDFGITWNQPMENGGFMVGKEVRISLDIEADLVSD